MIMPNKYLREDEALIGFGSVVLMHISIERSLSDLWEDVKNFESIGNFERFILVLDMLFLLGLIEFEKNKIKRVAA
tara:strand:+ start:30315 stop:30542 length:228 start_codon:yes stop_codon:yes gene_type:complete